jgi:GNAT superfamily N-acetyltransferase
MSMHIRRVDPADDAADLAAVLPVIRAAHADLVPGEPPPGAMQVRNWTGLAYRTTKVNFAAFPDASATEAIGVTMGAHPEPDPDLLGTWSFLSPDADGPEIAEALMESLFAYCRSRGIGRMVVNTAVNADAVRYAPQRAGERTFVAVRTGLDLAGIDRAALDTLSEPAAANAQYRIVHWVDTCPGEFAEAYCVARNAMNDAPAVAENVKHIDHDLERMRGEEQSSIRDGVSRRVTAALAPDGAIGGFTMTCVFADNPEFTEIWDTGVARDHRGHGLGVRLKAAGTLSLLRDHPEARSLYTVTAQDNAPMRAVNTRLGYQDAATWEIFLHKIPEAGASAGPDMEH